MDFIDIGKDQDCIDIYEDQPWFCLFRYSFDQVASNLLLATKVPQEEIRPMLIQAAAIQSALAASLETTLAETAVKPDQIEDELLTAEEAAKILNVTPRWLYSHAKKLPFTKRISRKCLRFSKAGLYRYINKRL
jgi:hypothetical protein